MLDVHRLRLLRELRHRGTLAAVARALGYSPSTISHQLDVLEREAGVPLLEPVGRRVQLTAEALLLVEHAEAVLERLERAEADLAAARGAATGTLRLATFQTVAHSLVIDLLARLEGGPLVLDVTHLTAQRALPPGAPARTRPRRQVTLHAILAHTVAEAQRHAGHADILRELVDGSSGHGPTGPLLPADDGEWWRAGSSAWSARPGRADDERRRAESPGGFGPNE